MLVTSILSPKCWRNSSSLNGCNPCEMINSEAPESCESAVGFGTRSALVCEKLVTYHLCSSVLLECLLSYQEALSRCLLNSWSENQAKPSLISYLYLFISVHLIHLNCIDFISICISNSYCLYHQRSDFQEARGYQSGHFRCFILWKHLPADIQYSIPTIICFTCNGRYSNKSATNVYSRWISLLRWHRQ